MTWIIWPLLALTLYFYIRLKGVESHINVAHKDVKTMGHNHKQCSYLTLSRPHKEMEALYEGLNLWLEGHYQCLDAYDQKIEGLRDEITYLSHDLRTPLTAILGYIDLLETCDRKDQGSYLSIIKRRSLYLNDLIRDLYDYSRLENDDFVFIKEQVDFKRLTQEHLLTYVDTFEAEGIDFDMACGHEQASYTIESDPAVLRRILDNLSSNLLKYTQGYGRVTLDQSDKQVLVEFKSTRSGLEDEDIKKLFERFYKKDKSRSAKGSGLGLTLTQVYVQKLGGQIRAYGDKDYLYIECRFPKVEG